MLDNSLNWEVSRVLGSIEGFEKLGLYMQRQDLKAISEECENLISDSEKSSSHAALAELKNRIENWRDNVS